MIISSYQSLINNSYGITETLKEKKAKGLIRNIIFDYIFGYNSENNDSFEIIRLIKSISHFNARMLFLSSTLRMDEIEYIKEKLLLQKK